MWFICGWVDRILLLTSLVVSIALFSFGISAISNGQIVWGIISIAVVGSNAVSFYWFFRLGSTKERVFEEPFSGGDEKSK